LGQSAAAAAAVDLVLGSFVGLGKGEVEGKWVRISLALSALELSSGISILEYFGLEEGPVCFLGFGILFVGMEFDSCLVALQRFINVQLPGGVDLVFDVLLRFDVDGREGRLSRYMLAWHSRK
jgi:hypothetical protein